MKNKLVTLIAVMLISVMTVSLTGCSSFLAGIFNLGSGIKDQGEDTTQESTLSEEELNNQLENAGALTGAITVSMLWNTYDDLDLHVYTPTGEEIYFSNPSAGGGTLDVDANAYDDSLVESPVENIYFSAPGSGTYSVYIYNYYDRTEGYGSDYLVRITVGDVSQTFSGTIDGTGTQVDIYNFTY